MAGGTLLGLVESRNRTAQRKSRTAGGRAAVAQQGRSAKCVYMHIGYFRTLHTLRSGIFPQGAWLSASNRGER